MPAWLDFLRRRPVYRNFTRAELDREYSPSSRVERIEPFLERYAELSEAARWRAKGQAAYFESLSYGVGAGRKLDLFLPYAPASRTLQVYIHGGYWQMLSKNDGAFAAPMFQRHGSHFAALGYPLAPQARLTEIVEDVRLALGWLFRHAEEYGFSPERIFVSGSSAGAHLAATTLLTDWRARDLPRDLVKGVCAVSGIYDLEPIRLSYVNEPLQLTAADVDALSPQRNLLRNHCPLILACGRDETAEFLRQSEEYRDLLRRNGEEVAWYLIGQRNHFDVVLDLADESTTLGRAVLAQMGLGDRAAGSPAPSH